MERCIVTPDPVPNRRGPFRRGPAFRTTSEYRRYVEAESRFLVVRAGDRTVGRKSDGEKRIRSASRIPFRADLNVFEQIIARAVETGDPDLYKEASDAIWDAVVEVVRLTSRLISEGKQRIAAECGAEFTDRRAA